MIKAKDTSVARRMPPPILNGIKAPKAKPKRAKKAAEIVATTLLRAGLGSECPTCKRAFPMTPAERQRKRRAKLKKAKK